MKIASSIQRWSNALSVRQKGLLVVSIPLAFQLIFTLSLGVLYARAEKEAWRESQARLVSVRVNTIVKDLWKAGQTLLAYSMLKDQAILSKWHERKATITEELDSLKKLSLESHNSKDAYNLMSGLSNRGISLMERAVQRIDDTSASTDIDVLAEVSPFMDALSKELDTDASAQIKDQSADILREEKSRESIAALLYVSVLADVVIAIALSAFFAASIGQRLFVISDNTRRARDKKELNATLDGTDEIANLDRQFHELVKELTASERLRSEFLAMTSHDLKTPLMSVELSLELISRQLSSDQSASVSEELLVAKNNMRRVLSLINDLLDLERGASGKLRLDLEDLDLQGLVQRSCQSVQALADRKKISLLVEIAPLEILGDRRRLEQVLVNLIANAVKFSPEQSTVLIRSKRLGGLVEIRVKDSGIGVAESNREKIFERFEQSGPGALEGDYGSGLGLAICKTIVQAHNGQIGVDANSDGGSEFWFRVAIVD